MPKPAQWVSEVRPEHAVFAAGIKQSRTSLAGSIDA
jgi:hypothetical protein